MSNGFFKNLLGFLTVFYITKGAAAAAPLKVFSLFKGDLSSLSFEFSLEVFSFCLGDSFFNLARSTVNESLSFLQAEAGNFTDNLDDLNFVRADLGKFNIKLILLFCCLCRACCCYNNTSCCGNTKLFFTSLDQFVQL